MIISPDNFLYESVEVKTLDSAGTQYGEPTFKLEYVWTQDRVIRAWRDCNALLLKEIEKHKYCLEQARRDNRNYKLPEFHIMVGAPGSGKSTLANKLESENKSCGLVIFDACMTNSRSRLEITRMIRDHLPTANITYQVSKASLELIMDRNQSRTDKKPIDIGIIQANVNRGYLSDKKHFDFEKMRYGVNVVYF